MLAPIRAIEHSTTARVPKAAEASVHPGLRPNEPIGSSNCRLLTVRCRRGKRAALCAHCALTLLLASRGGLPRDQWPDARFALSCLSRLPPSPPSATADFVRNARAGGSCRHSELLSILAELRAQERESKSRTGFPDNEPNAREHTKPSSRPSHRRSVWAHSSPSSARGRRLLEDSVLEAEASVAHLDLEVRECLAPTNCGN